MVQKIFTISGLTLAVLYIGWFVYERFTCISCWGNDIFFSIPFMALVPASLEANVQVKYIVVALNATLLFFIVYSLGRGIRFLTTNVQGKK